MLSVFEEMKRRLKKRRRSFREELISQYVVDIHIYIYMWKIMLPRTDDCRVRGHSINCFLGRAFHQDYLLRFPVLTGLIISHTVLPGCPINPSGEVNVKRKRLMACIKLCCDLYCSVKDSTVHKYFVYYHRVIKFTQ